MTRRCLSDEFARAFGRRSTQLAWLLGAGASAAANLPTGWDMILDFKTRLYCAQTGLARGEVDATDPLWLDRITTYFDGANGLPPAGDPSEYAAAFEAVYPQARDRRQYIDDAVRRGTPSFGHRVMAALIASRATRCVFTTNFDQLVERAAVVADDLLPPADQAHLTVAALDSAERAERCVRDDAWPLLVKLHGDYQSDDLKNTPAELQAQDERLRGVLTDVLGRQGLVVVGYSGRDDSVMDALGDALQAERPMPGGLWWATRPGTDLLPRVVGLLEAAESAGVDVAIVESENFDELAGDLDREVDLDEPLRRHVDGLRPTPLVQPVALPTVVAKAFPVLRCSALEILHMPTTARSITVKRPLTSVQARRLVREGRVWATVAARGHDLAVFGPDEEVLEALGSAEPALAGEMRLDPASDSTDRGLVYDALARALTRHRPLRPMLRGRGHDICVQPPDEGRDDAVAVESRKLLQGLRDAYRSPLVGVVPKVDLPYAEAIRIRAEVWDDRWFLVFEPFTWVDLPRPSHDVDPTDAATAERIRSQTVEAAGDWRRERWAQRYNSQWNAIIAGWAKLIAPSKVTELSAHHFRGPGVNADFQLSWTTAWSRPGRRRTTA